MTAQPEPRFLTVVGGTATAPIPQRKLKKPRKRPAEPDARIVAAGKIIEATLPAYVELHRVWAKGSSEAHAFVDANFPGPWRGGGEKSPAYVALRSIYASTGADAAQAGMSALFRKLAPLARMIERTPATSPEDFRAKALAAMWGYMAVGGHERGFNFNDADTFVKLFDACMRATGLSELAAAIKGRPT